MKCEVRCRQRHPGVWKSDGRVLLPPRAKSRSAAGSVGLCFYTVPGGIFAAT
jgi:hypothetical protein